MSESDEIQKMLCYHEIVTAFAEIDNDLSKLNLTPQASFLFLELIAIKREELKQKLLIHLKDDLKMQVGVLADMLEINFPDDTFPDSETVARLNLFKNTRKLRELFVASIPYIFDLFEKLKPTVLMLLSRTKMLGECILRCIPHGTDQQDWLSNDYFYMKCWKILKESCCDVSVHKSKVIDIIFDSNSADNIIYFLFRDIADMIKNCLFDREYLINVDVERNAELKADLEVRINPLFYMHVKGGDITLAFDLIRPNQDIVESITNMNISTFYDNIHKPIDTFFRTYQSRNKSISFKDTSDNLYTVLCIFESLKDETHKLGYIKRYLELLSFNLLLFFADNNLFEFIHEYYHRFLSVELQLNEKFSQGIYDLLTVISLDLIDIEMNTHIQLIGKPSKPNFLKNFFEFDLKQNKNYQTYRDKNIWYLYEDFIVNHPYSVIMNILDYFGKNGHFLIASFNEAKLILILRILKTALEKSTLLLEDYFLTFRWIHYLIVYANDTSDYISKLKMRALIDVFSILTIHPCYKDFKTQHFNYSRIEMFPADKYENPSLMFDFCEQLVGKNIYSLPITSHIFFSLLDKSLKVKFASFYREILLKQLDENKTGSQELSCCNKLLIYIMKSMPDSGDLIMKSYFLIRGLSYQLLRLFMGILMFYCLKYLDDNQLKDVACIVNEALEGKSERCREIVTNSLIQCFNHLNNLPNKNLNSSLSIACRKLKDALNLENYIESLYDYQFNPVVLYEIDNLPKNKITSKMVYLYFFAYKRLNSEVRHLDLNTILAKLDLHFYKLEPIKGNERFIVKSSDITKEMDIIVRKIINLIAIENVASYTIIIPFLKKQLFDHLIEFNFFKISYFLTVVCFKAFISNQAAQYVSIVKEELGLFIEKIKCDLFEVVYTYKRLCDINTIFLDTFELFNKHTYGLFKLMLTHSSNKFEVFEHMECVIQNEFNPAVKVILLQALRYISYNDTEYATWYWKSTVQLFELYCSTNDLEEAKKLFCYLKQENVGIHEDCEQHVILARWKGYFLFDRKFFDAIIIPVSEFVIPQSYELQFFDLLKPLFYDISFYNSKREGIVKFLTAASGRSVYISHEFANIIQAHEDLSPDTIILCLRLHLNILVEDTEFKFTHMHDLFIILEFIVEYKMCNSLDSNDNVATIIDNFFEEVKSDVFALNIHILIVEASSKHVFIRQFSCKALAKLMNKYPSRTCWWYYRLRDGPGLEERKRIFECLKYFLDQEVYDFMSDTTYVIKEFAQLRSYIKAFRNGDKKEVYFNKFRNSLNTKLKELRFKYSKHGWGLIVPNQEQLTSFVELSDYKQEIGIYSSEFRYVTEVCDTHVFMKSAEKPLKIVLKDNKNECHSFIVKYEILGDCRKEERISRFISCFNLLLNKAHKTRDKGLRVRRYEIITLKRDLNLIEWVKESTTLSSLIGPLNGRVIAAPGNKIKSEIFDQDPPERNNLRQYFKNISNNETKWFQRLQAYTKSFAASTAFGFLIMLGDRHFNNLLLDCETCEVIHIDFDMIFGKHLMSGISETVDFRLTSFMERPLGLFECWGLFRHYFKMIMETCIQHEGYLRTVLDKLFEDMKEPTGLCKQAPQKLLLQLSRLDGADLDAKIDELFVKNKDTNTLKNMYYGWTPHL